MLGNLKKSILPGEGIFEVFNQIIEGADKLISLVGKAADGIGSGISTGVASAFGAVTSVSLGSTFASNSDAPAQGQKLGLNAEKQLVASMGATDRSAAFECNMNDVVCPVLPKNVSRGTGISV